MHQLEATRARNDTKTMQFVLIITRLLVDLTCIFHTFMRQFSMVLVIFINFMLFILKFQNELFEANYVYIHKFEFSNIKFVLFVSLTLL